MPNCVALVSCVQNCPRKSGSVSPQRKQPVGSSHYEQKGTRSSPKFHAHALPLIYWLQKVFNIKKIEDTAPSKMVNVLRICDIRLQPYDFLKNLVVFDCFAQPINTIQNYIILKQNSTQHHAISRRARRGASLSAALHFRPDFIRVAPSITSLVFRDHG